MQSNSVFTVQALQSISTPLHVYKQAATGSQEFQDPCTWFMQNTSVFTLQALQSISTPLHVYKQAATGSQEFQDPCTWFMQNNSIFTVQALQSIYLSLYMYTNKLQRVLRNSKIPAHGSCKTILSLLCRHYNLYLLLYMYTNKLQQVFRSSKIPAHGPLNVILCTTQMVLRKVKTPDVVQPCKATLRIPQTCPGHQKEGHGSIPLE